MKTTYFTFYYIDYAINYYKFNF